MRQLARASQAFLDAWRSRDVAAMRRIGAARAPDPVYVLSLLHNSHVRAVATDAPDAPQFAAVADAFAEAARDNPAAEGVVPFRRAWRRFVRADFERERRLREAYDRLHRKNDRASCEADLATIRAAEPDMAEAVASTRVVNLLFERVRALQALDRMAEALAEARTAAAAAAAVPWPGGEARALRAVAGSALLTGDMPAAVAAHDRAAAIYRRLGRLDRSTVILRSKASILRLAARYPEALAAARSAHADARAAGRVRDAIMARVAEANVHASVGRGADAERVGREAALDAERAGDVETTVAAWLSVGNACVMEDRFAGALHAFERATAASARHPALATRAWTSLGVTHRRMRHLEAALADQRRALAEAEVAGDPALVALAMGNLGITMSDLGMPAFRRTLEEALAGKRRVGDRTGAAETLLSLANILARAPETSEEGVAMLRGAVEEIRAVGDPLRLAVAHSAVGSALARSGDLEGSLEQRRAAADLLERVGDRSTRMADVQDGLAGIHLLSGRVVEAVAAARRGVEIRRALAAGLGVEDAAALVERARASSDVGMEAAEALLATDAAAAAAAGFDFLEGGRATLLAAGIVNAEALLAAEVPAPALAAEAEGRARVAAARRRLVAAAAAREPDPRGLEAARRDLDEASARHSEAVARVRREAEHAAGVAFPSPASLTAAREALAADEAFVGWQVTPARVLAVVVRREGAHLRPLGPAEGLAASAEGFVRMASTAGADDRTLAASLYDRLVGPLEPDLAGVRRVYLAPDGPLAFVPFEALLRVRGGTRERMVERVEATYVPSATVLLTLLAEERGRRPGRGFVGVGDPDYAARATNGSGLALPPLPRSREEVLAVAALYAEEPRTVLLGERATVEAVLAALPAAPGRVRALHVAAHAFVDPEHPRLSSLVLAGGQVLGVDDIHRLRVPADVAVLSACSTGRGALLRGEGVLGFARGFFFAGVPRVVVSDWVVSDARSASLLRAFHEQMVREGRPAAAALRAAKLAALRSGGEAAHPFAWAPFVLWGLP